MAEETQETHSSIFTVVVLLCGALLSVLNTTLLSPALPTIMGDFGVDATTVQWLTSIYTLTESVVIPLSAYLLGRFKTRNLYFTGIGLFTLFSLVAALAPNFPVLVFARAMQAVGSGIIMPMTVTLVMLSFPREQRGTAMGLVTLVIGFAPAIGPTLGGVLIDVIGWRALFGLVTVLGFVVLFIAFKFIENREGFESYALDIPSVVLMMCGMIALLYGISSSTSAANIAVPIALIIVGVVVLAFFVRRQLQLEKPMLKVSVLASSRFRIDVIAVMIMQCGMTGGSVILSLYVQNVMGYSATISGLVMLPGAVLGAIMGMISGKIFDRYGARGISCVGVTLLALSGIGLTLCDLDTSLVFIFLVNTGISFATQMITTPLNTWGVNSLDNSVIQHANSLSNSLNQVAGSIGTALLTALTALGPTFAPNGSALEQTYMGVHVAYIGQCALTIVCALIVYIFVHDKQKQPATEGATDTTAATTAGATACTSTAASRQWTVADAMDRNPKYVREDQKVGDAFKLFADTETDGLPVLDADDNVVGYISDGDVLKYLGKQDMNFSSAGSNLTMLVDDENMQDTMIDMLDLNVMKLATKKAITLDEGTTLEEACSMFVDRKLKKAPVVVDGKLVGSLSRRNIMGFVGDAAKQRRA